MFQLAPAVVVALVILLGSLFVHADGGTQPNGAIIPAYIFPTLSAWDNLFGAIQAAELPKSKVWIILNANNGVIGNVTDWEKEQWKALAGRVKKHARALVYINLCNRVPGFSSCGDPNLQGARPADEALGYLDDWITDLGRQNIFGVFFDDTPMDGTNKGNILNIINGVRDRHAGFRIVTNPGVPATDADLLNAVDVTVYDEGTSPDSEPPPNELEEYKKKKFAMILNNDVGNNWEDYFEMAHEDGYEWFYASTAGYDVLPLYLDSMLKKIKKD